MPYVKQAITLFLLMLFLQACDRLHHELTNPAASVPPQVVDAHLPLKNAAEINTTSGDIFDAEIYSDIEFDSQHNPKFDSKSKSKSDSKPKSKSDSGYDSGYDTDTKLISKKESLPPFNDVKNNLEFDFEYSIKNLREEADKRRNIKWHLSGDQLTRMVNYSTGNTNLYAAEDYVVIGLNVYRAAKKVYRLHGKIGAVFVEKAHQLIKYYSDNSEKSEYDWIETIKDINKKVVVHLQKTLFPGEDLNTINEKLRLAENYVGLDDTHYDVTTIFEVDGKKFALEDKKCFPLTEKQKRSYKNRQSEKWYIRLSEFERKFIDAYFNKFLDGSHYIPTQLRSIVGCRNAYQKRILTYDKNNNPIVLGGYYHSGSFPSPIEWEDKVTDLQITKDNWEQVIKQAKDVEVISLNYNMDLPYFKQVREKKIVEDTKQVVPNDQFMNLSINEIGTSYNLDNQYDKLIKKTLIHYEDKYPDVCAAFSKYDAKKESLIKKICSLFSNDVINPMEQAIEKIQDVKDKIFFKKLVALEEAAKGSQDWSKMVKQFFISDNRNANTGASYIACKSFLNKNKATFPVLFSCKSGKDRTGLMSYLVDGNIIHMSDPSLPVEKVYETLPLCSHYQFLASVNGGMPGRFGMKSVKLNETSRRFAPQLFTGAAHYTAIRLIKSKDDLLDDAPDGSQSVPSVVPSKVAALAQ